MGTVLEPNHLHKLQAKLSHIQHRCRVVCMGMMLGSMHKPSHLHASLHDTEDILILVNMSSCSSSDLLKSHAVSVLSLAAEEGLVHLMRHFQGISTQDLHEHWVDCMVQPVDNEFDTTFAYMTGEQPLQVVQVFKQLLNQYNQANKH